MSIIRKQPQSPHYALAIQEYSLAMKTISVDEKEEASSFRVGRN